MTHKRNNKGTTEKGTNDEGTTDETTDERKVRFNPVTHKRQDDVTERDGNDYADETDGDEDFYENEPEEMINESDEEDPAVERGRLPPSHVGKLRADRKSFVSHKFSKEHIDRPSMDKPETIKELNEGPDTEDEVYALEDEEALKELKETKETKPELVSKEEVDYATIRAPQVSALFCVFFNNLVSGPGLQAGGPAYSAWGQAGKRRAR